MWQYRGKARPTFAREPGPGQESVWDYPRPPVAVRDHRRVEVFDAQRRIVSTTRAIRILETASPPTFYLPPDDVERAALVAVAGVSWCEWKGAAGYWALASDPDGRAVAWSYAEPNSAFAEIRDYLSFYPGRLRCTVDGAEVRAQPGDFYGGWITAEVVGPFKGEPGTAGW